MEQKPQPDPGYPHSAPHTVVRQIDDDPRDWEPDSGHVMVKEGPLPDGTEKTLERVLDDDVVIRFETVEVCDSRHDAYEVKDKIGS